MIPTRSENLAVLKIALVLTTILVLLSHLVMLCGCFLVLTLTGILPSAVLEAVTSVLPAAPAYAVLTWGEGVILALMYMFGGLYMIGRFSDERKELIARIEEIEARNTFLAPVPTQSNV